MCKWHSFIQLTLFCLQLSSLILAHRQLNLWLRRAMLERAVELAFKEKTTENCRD